MTHCTISWFDYESFLLPFFLQFFHIVLELSVFSREDPRSGDKSIIQRPTLNHSVNYIQYTHYLYSHFQNRIFSNGTVFATEIRIPSIPSFTHSDSSGNTMC